MPTDPSAKPMGIKTAVSTSVIPIIAGVISAMASRVASRGERFFSSISRSTFSTTTMASSTIIPIASTMPNMVRILIEYPLNSITVKVPSSATGATIAGISVQRIFCKNSNITRKTRTIASTNVCTTFMMDSFTNGAVSKGTVNPIPSGNT